MKKTQAFTLVELIVSISIIALISVSWLTYYSKITSWNKIQTELALLEDKINDLNFRVESKEIVDYNANLSWSTYFSYIINKITTNSKTSFSLDENTKTLTLKTNLTNTWFWELTIFAWERVDYNALLNWDDIFSGTLNKNISNEIKLYFDNKNHLLWIYYFSDDNLSYDEWKLNFIWVYKNPERLWEVSKDFNLKNINWKLSFFDENIEWNVNDVYIFFEKSWEEKFVKISK